MTREDINDIIKTLCPNDEDFEKPIISPVYLKKELEALALEQEPETVTEFADRCRECGREKVVDKIRAEIESCREDAEPHLCDYRHHRNEGLEMALDIIDKYKAESEVIKNENIQIL